MSLLRFLPIPTLPTITSSRFRDLGRRMQRTRHFCVSSLTQLQNLRTLGEIAMWSATYQRSTSKPAMRENSPTLRVTSTCELEMAVEAIMRSFPPMGLPSRRSCALTIP